MFLLDLCDGMRGVPSSMYYRFPACRVCVLTGFAVVQVLSVQSPHSLHQLPLLTATGKVDKIPGQDFLQLSHSELLHVVHARQVRERRSPRPPHHLTNQKELHLTPSTTVVYFLFSFPHLWGLFCGLDGVGRVDDLL